MNIIISSFIFIVLIGGTYSIIDPKFTNVDNQAKIDLVDAMNQLDSSDRLYLEYYQHGTMKVGLYGPVDVDPQNPHEQDELYVIVQGSGKFIADGIEHDFEKGDVLFVAAQTDHRFVEFSTDFKTWVFFYGPEGGEK